jgi:hypothetical protein
MDQYERGNARASTRNIVQTIQTLSANPIVEKACELRFYEDEVGSLINHSDKLVLAIKV